MTKKFRATKIRTTINDLDYKKCCWLSKWKLWVLWINLWNGYTGAIFWTERKKSDFRLGEERVKSISVNPSFHPYKCMYIQIYEGRGLNVFYFFFFLFFFIPRAPALPPVTGILQKLYTKRAKPAAGCRRYGGQKSLFHFIFFAHLIFFASTIASHHPLNQK